MTVAIKEVEYLASQMSHQKSKYIFWLGAGMSVTAGIPAGPGIVDRLLDRTWRDRQSSCNQAQNLEPYSALSEAARKERLRIVREWALVNFEGIAAPTLGTEKIEHDQVDWGAQYSRCLALLPGEQVRQSFIVKCIKEGRGKLNLAHLLLAQLMVNDFVRIVLTTNFDDILLRALQLYFEIPSIIDADSTHTLMIDSMFLQVAYLHGRLTSYRQRHTELELHKSMPELENFIASSMKDHGLVVVGYRGGDEAPMKILAKVLKKRGAGPGGGLFWVSYEKDFEKLSEGARKILKLKDTYWLGGCDADTFFEKLCASPGIGLSLPDFLRDPKKFATRIVNILPEEARGPWNELQEIATDVAISPVEAFLAAAREEPSESEALGRTQSSLEKLEIPIHHGVWALESPEQAVATFSRQAETEPGASWVFSGWGDALANLGRFDEALEKYQRATEIDPESSSDFLQWGNALMRLKRYDEAIEKYQRTIEIDPQNVLAFLQWGDALMELDCYDEALEKYHRVTEIDPHNSSAFISSGQALREQGRLDDAISKYRQATEADPKLAWAFYYWGKALQEQGHIDEAISKYRQATEADPKHSWAFYYWGNALQEQGHVDEAISKYRQATEADTEHHWAFYSWGAILQKQGRDEEAIEKYRQAAEADPKAARAFLNWGNVLKKLGRDEEAIEKYRQAAEADPKAARAFLNWGNVLKKLGHDEEAIEKYRQAAEADPNNAPTFLNWGNVLKKLGHDEEAIEKYRQAAELDSKNANALANWGDVLRKLGRDEEAIEKYRQATEISPKFAGAFAMWGNTLHKLGRDDEAIEKYQRALEINPKLAGPLVFWGNTLHKLGRDDEAIEKYRRAMEIDANSWVALSGWASALQRLGRDEEAVSLLEQALKLNPQKASTHVSLAGAYRKLGLKPEYGREIALASEMITSESEYNRACFESVRGNVDEALAQLKAVLEKNQQSRAWARRDPDFDFIRDDPRFQALVLED
jgi:tetratricopeptide (TPR) repeat protein